MLKRHSLGSKIVFYMIVANVFLSLISSAIQLQSGFNHDRDIILDKFERIETSFGAGFENALWQFNFQQIDLLLNSVFADLDVDYVSLQSDSDHLWTRGAIDSNGLIFRQVDLRHDRDGMSEIIGVLEVGLSLDEAKARVWSNFLTILTSNFIKASLASFLMLVIFNRLVSRHLGFIAAHVSQENWLDEADYFTLQRPQNKHVHDELDRIVGAINAAQRQGRESYRTLALKVFEQRVAEDVLRDRATELWNHNAKLRELNQEQTQFSYSISHDLKAPTNTVAMLLHELKLEKAKELGDDGVELLSMCEETIQRMGRMVEDVLEYSKTAEIENTLEAIQLNGLIDEIIIDLGGDIKTSNAAIDLKSLPVVMGNTMMFRVLFQNLIANAIKFRSNDRDLAIKIHSRKSEDKAWNIIIVSDNGIGIDEKFHQEIFNLFQRLHTHDEYPGTGLGLALCKRIVLNHNGRINVYSEPGVGTTFEVFLPNTFKNK